VGICNFKGIALKIPKGGLNIELPLFKFATALIKAVLFTSNSYFWVYLSLPAQQWHQMMQMPRDL